MTHPTAGKVRDPSPIIAQVRAGDLFGVEVSKPIKADGDPMTVVAHRMKYDEAHSYALSQSQTDADREHFLGCVLENVHAYIETCTAREPTTQEVGEFGEDVLLLLSLNVAGVRRLSVEETVAVIQ
eukprot:Opistho-2@58101